MCYLKHTKDHSLQGFIGDPADQLSILLFTDASYADCVQSSKSTTGIDAAIVGPNTFFPLNAVCKKQTVVSHSSTESEIVALDSALRLDGVTITYFLGTCGCRCITDPTARLRLRHDQLLVGLFLRLRPKTPFQNDGTSCEPEEPETTTEDVTWHRLNTRLL